MPLKDAAVCIDIELSDQIFLGIVGSNNQEAETKTGEGLNPFFRRDVKIISSKVFDYLRNVFTFNPPSLIAICYVLAY